MKSYVSGKQRPTLCNIHSTICITQAISIEICIDHPASFLSDNSSFILLDSYSPTKLLADFLESSSYALGYIMWNRHNVSDLRTDAIPRYSYYNVLRIH